MEYTQHVSEQRKVVVIGAGPSGSIASAILKRKGYDVLVIEKQKFPRFSIGESLLSHCLDFIEEAGMLEAVEQAGYQVKHGAAFGWGDDKYVEIDFRDQFTPGKTSTFQVKRAEFDQLLADQAELQGVEIRYQEEIIAGDFDSERPILTVRKLDGEIYKVQADFVLDASGYGRVLPRLLDLETPSSLAVRKAVFTHVQDNITDPQFNREKILITTHPKFRDIWFWTIPFSDGTTSLGVVGELHLFLDYPEELELCLKQFVQEAPNLRRIFKDAVWSNPFRTLVGYSANVKRLYGKNFALLGNAAEFLDPVFSSGVTIGMRSSSMAANLLDRQFKGQQVDWETEFSDQLKLGVETFRTYVEGWYDTRFQDVIYYEKTQPDIRRMICSILAGYAWDTNNPYVADHKRRLNVLAEFCRCN